MSGFQAPITIKDIIDKIHKKEYLLPGTWLGENEECIPIRILYLNVKAPVEQNYNPKKQFDWQPICNEHISQIIFCDSSRM